MQLISYWKLWYKRWSTWLAGLFAVVTTSIVAYPGLLLGLLAYFPGNYRTFLAGAVFVIVFAVPVIIAQLRQPKLEERKD